LERRYKRFEKIISVFAGKALKILKKDKISVEIYLADNKRMRILNKKFRGKDKTTTVLSFEEPRNFILPPSKIKKIGEIYLNMDIMQKMRMNANAANKFSQYSHKFVVWHYYLVHGLLHLLGYNHYKKNDKIKMERKEQYILARL
jgi:probable rRNA maturation factor